MPLQPSDEPLLVLRRFSVAHKDLVLFALRAWPRRPRRTPPEQPIEQTSHRDIGRKCTTVRPCNAAAGRSRLRDIPELAQPTPPKGSGRTQLMRMLVLIPACAGVGGLLLGWLLSRLRMVVAGRAISFSGGVLVRSAGGLALAWVAVGAGERGGLWLGITAVTLGLLALFMFVLEGSRVWWALKYGVAQD